MTVFDTETMAELCVKQGLHDQALGIFRRLAEEATDPAVRQRCQARLAELAQAPGSAPEPAPLEIPGLRLTERAGSVEIEWRLPPETASPTLQLLLLRRTPEGIEAERRDLPLPAARGRTVIAVADVYGARAAAGRLDGEAFVPLVRYPDRMT